MTNDRLQYDMNLIDASRFLRMMPRVILRCISYAPRPNGIKLDCEDKDGQVFFYIATLKAFDDDLREPWVKKAADNRPPIPAYFEEALRFESRQRCAVCKSPHGCVLAHIEEWATCLHHHPHNIINLCSRCHDGYDKEKRITKEELLKIKSSVLDWALSIVTEEHMVQQRENQKPLTFHELCARIDDFLSINHMLFWNFGPSSELAKSSGDPSAVAPWHLAIEEKILPNNKSIVHLLTSCKKLYEGNAEFKELADRFIVHAQSYEIFVKKPNTAHQHMLFPQRFSDIVRKEVDNNG
jgi:hypothetical protein